MRRSLFLAAVPLAACAAASPPDAVQIHGVTPGHKCDASSTDSFIGQIGSSETGAAIMHATRAAVLRWAPPNTMLTMDYREDRVTVWLDEANKITKLRCG
jgi:hypothetical protein